MFDPLGPFPLIPADLLEHLEQRYPDRSPEPNQSDRDIWMAVGAVRLVRRLRQAHEDQLNTLI